MLISLFSIAVLHWAVLLIPGFNFVLIGQLAAGGSRRAAMAAVGGMTAATLLWASLAVGGVGVVFTSHPSVRMAAQVAGGLYLLYLAVKLWRAGGPGGGDDAMAVLGAGAAFRVGFMTSALNPKIALFYGSVFATALPPDPSLAMALAAVLLVFVNSVVWHSFLALLLSRPGVQRRYLQHQQGLNKVAAGLVGFYGLRLLLQARAG
jgi:threonine efflux protein